MIVEFLFSRAVVEVCGETRPAERSSINMELQEIDDRLKNLEKEIEELESKKQYSMFIENLLLEQQTLMLKVCQLFAIS